MALTAAVALLLLIPVAIAIHVSAGSWSNNALTDFNGFGMWGVFAIYLWTRPSWKEASIVFCLAASLRIAAGLASSEHLSVLDAGAYLPFFCLPILGYRGYKRPLQPSYRLSFYGLLLFSYIGICLGFYLSLAKAICHYKYDYLLYAFDGALGPHVNFWLGKAASASVGFGAALETTYRSLGLFMAILFAAHVNRANNTINILKLNVANAVGISLYFLYPAMGPKYAFTSFPHLPGAVPPAAALLAGIPNAMPSLHIACALLIFFLSRPWKWFRCIAGIFLALTVLAVFGTGEHYEVDAIVAIPYALTIMAFASSVKERTSVLRAGAGMLILWLVVLRFGSFNPWTSWGLVLTTVAAGFVMERRFAKSLWGAAIPRAVRECGPNGQPFLAAQAFSQAFSPAEPPRSRGTLLSI